MPDPKPLDYTATLSTAPSPVLNEQGIEEAFIQRLEHLKYQYRPDIRDRAALEANFREKFETTGRGRTLTSFKAATLLKENFHIHQCVFVVDRKDLDRLTGEEFNRFQEGCVEEKTHNAALARKF